MTTSDQAAAPPADATNKPPDLDKVVAAWEKLLELSVMIARACASAAALAKRLAEDAAREAHGDR